MADLIKKLKFNFVDDIAPILGRFLSLYWSGIILNNPVLKNSGLINNRMDDSLIYLSPLPLSKNRQNWRGFNQSELIAKSFNEDYNYKINYDLKRIKDTKVQSSLNEKERAENIKNCFVWAGQDLKDKVIILVDDVITTGATLNEAARILKDSGAKKVYGLIVAKG